MRKLKVEGILLSTPSYITLDELIESLQEAKEHCISGNTIVKVTVNNTSDNPLFVDVVYDNNNVELVIN